MRPQVKCEYLITCFASLCSAPHRQTEISGKGIQQFNTLQWKNEDGGVSFSRYTSKLSNPTGGFDVDAVDGSFSTDHTLLDLNLPGADKNVIGTFAIETR